jgi:hypothetical protein
LNRHPAACDFSNQLQRCCGELSLGETAMIFEMVEPFTPAINLEGENQWKKFQHCFSCA